MKEKEGTKTVERVEVFNFSEKSTPVRVQVINGEPWFVAKDVCDRLGLTNSRKALKPLDDDEKGVTSSYTPGGVQRVSIVNESGLYSLVFQSRKPDAPGAPGGQWAQAPAGRSVGQASKMRSG